MVKISRPILYTALLGAAAYTVVLYYQPDAAPVRPILHRTSAAAKSVDGITEADYHASFPRYRGAVRDAFIPLVAPKKVSHPEAEAILGNGPGATGNWALTGITVVNGVRNGVVENQSTHEIAFLKPGDRWNGLIVTSVMQNAVLLTNALNKPIRMTFAAPPPPTAPAAAPTTPAAPGAAAQGAAGAPPGAPPGFPGGQFPAGAFPGASAGGPAAVGPPPGGGGRFRRRRGGPPPPGGTLAPATTIPPANT
ncbi:MAG TPA: hypothetical protein VGS41_14865 [Chthonomonadales bacterium]|nr:hypothetical protein [Chthonomonadales bacterium]